MSVYKWQLVKKIQFDMIIYVYQAAIISMMTHKEFECLQSHLSSTQATRLSNTK